MAVSHIHVYEIEFAFSCLAYAAYVYRAEGVAGPKTEVCVTTRYIRTAQGRNKHNSTVRDSRTAYESRNTKSPDLGDRSDRTRHQKIMWVVMGEAVLALSDTAPIFITSGVDLPIVVLMH